jgi:hypothetical protein
MEEIRERGVEMEMRATTQEQLSSGDARAAILSRHEELRGLVIETMQFADEAAKSDRDFGPLRAHAKDLYLAFEEHLDFEERMLATALSDVIGWSFVLRAQIEEGHEKLRATLAVAMSALEPASLSCSHLVETVRELADSILLDLQSEERCLLTADLDALAVDCRGG